MPLRDLTPKLLGKNLGNTAFAFKGYNVRNLGKTPELLAHPRYGAILERTLIEASEICSDVMGAPVDLVARVRTRHVETLADYHESIMLVIAAELAQIEILREHFGIELAEANLAYGFSMGELAVLAATNVLTMRDAVEIPLKMSKDAAELAQDVTLGVIFSRSGKMIDRNKVRDLCTKINAERQGVIDVSTYLSPNSMLLLGQGDTIDRFKKRLGEISDERIAIRKNSDKWPPLHTSIVWQRNITNRSQVLMQQIQSGFTAPAVPLYSMATGDFPYDGTNTREIVGRWIDQPQRLWGAVDTTLARGVKTVIHVGPAPNIIPATFKRLAANVEAMAKSGRSRMPVQTLSRMVERKWLAAMLPKRVNLLRAPTVRHINLEDWLLQQEIDHENHTTTAAARESADSELTSASA